ncbi:MAG: hypothetical protein HN790_01705 [Methylococcales bacterium]|mgnify:CR=1 FL=1|jgi:hypothetical protein|nr:hypothetical protein [Methylococcales bacterium]
MRKTPLVLLNGLFLLFYSATSTANSDIEGISKYDNLPSFNQTSAFQSFSNTKSVSFSALGKQFDLELNLNSSHKCMTG